MIGRKFFSSKESRFAEILAVGSRIRFWTILSAIGSVDLWQSASNHWIIKLKSRYSIPACILLKFIRHDCPPSNSSSSGKRWTEKQAPRATSEGIKLHQDALVAAAAHNDCGGNKRNIFLITVTFLTQRLSHLFRHYQ